MSLILGAIDKVLKEEYERQKGFHDPKSKFYISGLGLCLKGAYYKRLGAEGPYSEAKQRIFYLGSELENLVACALQSNSEVRILKQQGAIAYPEYDLYGKFDFLLKFPDGKIRLVEMKTMNSGGFRTMKNRLEPAKPHHASQVALYWNKLKDEYPNLEVSVLYVDKDTFDMYEYVFSPEQIQMAYEDAIKRAKILKEAWDNKAPPDVEEDAWVERYCEVHTYCVGTQKL